MHLLQCFEVSLTNGHGVPNTNTNNSNSTMSSRGGDPRIQSLPGQGDIPGWSLSTPKPPASPSPPSPPPPLKSPLPRRRLSTNRLNSDEWWIIQVQHSRIFLHFLFFLICSLLMLHCSLLRFWKRERSLGPLILININNFLTAPISLLSLSLPFPLS